MGVLILAALGDEDGVVVALSEDEGGEDDVDDVELDAQQRHDAQYPQPAHRHGEEGEQCQFDAAEGEPEEEEDDGGAGEADVVEVVGKGACQCAVHAADVEGVVEACLDALHVLLFHGELVHDGVSPCLAVDADVAGEDGGGEGLEVVERLRTVLGGDDAGEVREGFGGEAVRCGGGGEAGGQLVFMLCHE